MRVVGITGNLTRPSKTGVLAAHIAATVSAKRGLHVFFDLLDIKALTSRPVIAFATGRSPGHGKQVEAYTRALTDFFDARMVAEFIYAMDQDFNEGGLGNSLRSVADRVVDKALRFDNA
ncbi:hypothetical protein [Rhizobium sp. A37_96]